MKLGLGDDHRSFSTIRKEKWIHKPWPILGIFSLFPLFKCYNNSKGRNNLFITNTEGCLQNHVGFFFSIFQYSQKCSHSENSRSKYFNNKSLKLHKNSSTKKKNKMIPTSITLIPKPDVDKATKGKAAINKDTRFLS